MLDSVRQLNVFAAVYSSLHYQELLDCVEFARMPSFAESLLSHA